MADKENIIKKLSEVQHKLKANKSQYNKFGNYAYRSSEDILEAVKPLLGDCSIILTDEIIEVAGRVYVRSQAQFLSSLSGEGISTFGFAREPSEQKGMSASQITGSASSYARKYSLNGLLLIDDNKDDDSRDNSKAVVDLPILKPNTPEWANVVKGLKGGYKMKDVETKYSVTEANKKKLNEESKKEI